MEKSLKKCFDIFSNNFYLKLLYLFSSFTFITILSIIPGISVLTTISILWAIILIPITTIRLIKHRNNLSLLYLLIYSFLFFNFIITLLKYPTIENIKICIINAILLIVFFSIDSYKSKELLIKEFSILSYFYVVLNFILSTPSLIMILFKTKIPIVTSNGVEYYQRSAGLFYNENALGICSGICILLALYLYFKAENNKSKAFLIINIVIQSATMILSGGRSGYLILLSLVYIFLIFKIKNIFLKICVAVSPIISLLVLFFTNPKILHLIFTGRNDIWRVSFKIIDNYPIFGVGYTDLLNKFHELRDIWLPAFEEGRLHNIYIETFATSGAISGILLLIILAIIFILLYKYISKYNRPNKNLYIIIISLIFGLLLVNFMESLLIYSMNFLSIMFWSISGYLLAIITCKEN